MCGHAKEKVYENKNNMNIWINKGPVVSVFEIDLIVFHFIFENERQEIFD